MLQAEIRVKGRIDERWSDWFQDLTVTHTNQGETILSGSVTDQAALYGLIAKLREAAKMLRELADVLEQARQDTEAEMTHLNVECRDLERQLRRDDAEIRRLAAKGPATGVTAARIADLAERVQRAETRLAELREQKDALARERIDEAELKAAFEDFDNVWSALSPREQAEVLQLLIARVDYEAADSSISITFHPSGIKALSEGPKQEEAA